MAERPDLDRPRDDESALRLIHPSQFQDKRITSAAFRTRPIDNPRYRTVSLFVKERLPTGDGECLHVAQFDRHGRAMLSFDLLRSVSYNSEGAPVPCEFDAQMTPVECLPPLDAFADAHATLSGPTHKNAAIAALALQFNTRGTLEKLPNNFD